MQVGVCSDIRMAVDLSPLKETIILNLASSQVLFYFCIYVFTYLIQTLGVLLHL